MVGYSFWSQSTQKSLETEILDPTRKSKKDVFKMQIPDSNRTHDARSGSRTLDPAWGNAFDRGWPVVSFSTKGQKDFKRTVWCRNTQISQQTPECRIIQRSHISTRRWKSINITIWYRNLISKTIIVGFYVAGWLKHCMYSSLCHNEHEELGEVPNHSYTPQQKMAT